MTVRPFLEERFFHLHTNKACTEISVFFIKHYLHCAYFHQNKTNKNTSSYSRRGRERESNLMSTYHKCCSSTTPLNFLDESLSKQVSKRRTKKVVQITNDN